MNFDPAVLREIQFDLNELNEQLREINADVADGRVHLPLVEVVGARCFDLARSIGYRLPTASDIENSGVQRLGRIVLVPLVQCGASKGFEYLLGALKDRRIEVVEKESLLSKIVNLFR